MSVHNRVICAIVLALVSISASCSQPKYLVKGLSLPPGSTEVSYDKDINAINNLPFPVPAMGKIEHNVTVNFNCKSGWDSVASHIDSCMQRAGYQSATSQLGNVPGMGEVAKGLADINKMGRTYTKMGGKFMVMLMNNNWMADSTGMPAIDLGMADYTLTVMEFEGDK